MVKFKVSNNGRAVDMFHPLTTGQYEFFDGEIVEVEHPTDIKRLHLSPKFEMLSEPAPIVKEEVSKPKETKTSKDKESEKSS